MRKAFWGILLLCVVMHSCRTPFEPEVSSLDGSFLVVEGYLDSEGKRSELKLSRSTSLADSVFADETGAVVTLYADSGESYPLTEEGEGIYVFERNISESQLYSLEIVLQNGDRIRSESMRPILTPDIIDAGFVKDEEGVEVFVTTQGDANADDFLWTFEETWIYRPRVRTPFIYDAAIGDVRTRTSQEQIELCFKSEDSPGILLETSSRFEEQVVFRQTITEIPTANERIMERYSILISQKAIEDSAVKFWEILKKNTEDIGSIFSPLPSLIVGNLKAMDGSETVVVGQVSLGVIRERRIYIDRVEVSPWNYIDPEFNDCFIEAAPVLMADYASAYSGRAWVPARSYSPPGSTVVTGYFPAPYRCADCTLYASPVKPDFWEDE